MTRPLALLLTALLGCATAPRPATPAVPPTSQARLAPAHPHGLLSWSEQLAERERWLAKKHGLLLDMMRRHGVGMWIVANEEFHDDPLTPHVAPPRPYAGGRDLFVFVDAGPAGLERHAVAGYAEENLTAFFESPDEPRPAQEALAELYRRYTPRTIALSFGGSRGVTRSLTHDTFRFIADALGKEAEARFVPAEPLIEEYLDTRLPEETPHYLAAVRLTEQLVREALSNRVIRPGVTTAGDLRRYLFDRTGELGLGLWFQPDVRVQKRGVPNASSRGFLAVSPEATRIERGDLVHIDFGLVYMGLYTDWQKMAYVLRDGETDAPAGLQAALANTNALQDTLMRHHSRPGRSSAEVYDATMAEMKQRGIHAQVYSHPLGNQGHALGAHIDFRSARRGQASKPLRKGSYIAVELNTLTPVPEWGGQEVFVMQEDPAYLTDTGFEFFVPRQEAFYLVR